MSVEFNKGKFGVGQDKRIPNVHLIKTRKNIEIALGKRINRIMSAPYDKLWPFAALKEQSALHFKANESG